MNAETNCGVTLMQGDCLERMKEIPDGSVDMILADLPYGMTACEWDTRIPFEPLWEQYRRVIKENGVVVLSGSGAFSAEIINSNLSMYRYSLIWDKRRVSGFLNANRMPLKQHEDIIVFYKKLPTYNPQMRKCSPQERTHSTGKKSGEYDNRCYGRITFTPARITDEKYPTSIISIPKEHKTGEFFHPTQKPVALLEYLIKTYTNEGETVLDNVMGSGSTGVAAVNTGRKFIGIELDEKFYETAKNRIEKAIEEKEKAAETEAVF